MNKRRLPTRFTPDHSDLARKFCMLGATDDELARLLEVPRETIDAWLAEVVEFADAVKAGRDVADATVAERLYARAIGFSHPAVKIFQSGGAPLEVPYTEHYPPDIQACIFWLRNRRRQDWRDKIEHEQTAASDLLAELDAAGERARNARR
jgi:hypothetical protein